MGIDAICEISGNCGRVTIGVNAVNNVGKAFVDIQNPIVIVINVLRIMNIVSISIERFTPVVVDVQRIRVGNTKRRYISI